MVLKQFKQLNYVYSTTQAHPAVTVCDARSAIVWLLHCQRYSIDEQISACELRIGQNFLQLASDRAEPLAPLSSPFLIRISRAYARCSWAQAHLDAKKDFYMCSKSACDCCYRCKVSLKQGHYASALEIGAKIVQNLKSFLNN